MPELPEVETVRLQLLYKLKGKAIKKTKVFERKSVGQNTHFEKTLSGKTISQIDRVGKLMIFCFAQEDNLFMLAHLKMTGQFFFSDKNGVMGGGHSVTKTDWQKLPNKHTRVAFTFSDNTNLYFNDMRKFGYLKLVNMEELQLIKSKFGPEPTSKNFDVLAFSKKLKNHRTSIKALLLNQSIVAGLGNIYVDETLFRAGVLPTRLANQVTKSEAGKIARFGGLIMNKAISVGGTTFQHFTDTTGKVGNYTKQLQVFGKQNTPCPKCGNLIKKVRVAGRGTHYCPHCQK